MSVIQKLATYDSYAFLWPPRPERAIPPDMLDRYERLGWIAQIKKNGTGNVLAVSPDRKVTAMRRDRTEHKAWASSERTEQAFRDLPGTGWYVFVAELMHSKGGGLRDINYINDVLVIDGEYLVGSTFADRQVLLRGLFPTTTRSLDGHYYVIDQHTWLAQNYEHGFRALFDGLSRVDDEGLVLKDRNAKLAPCSRENSNSPWQRKCRRETKNYGF